MSQETSTLKVESAGHYDGNFARISINDTEIGFGTYTRGLNVAVFDQDTGGLLNRASFDTYESKKNAKKFADFINEIPTGRIVALAVQDEASSQLFTEPDEQQVKEAFQSIGSIKYNELNFRSSWALIGEKGAEPGTATEKLTKPIPIHKISPASVELKFGWSYEPNPPLPTNCEELANTLQSCLPQFTALVNRVTTNELDVVGTKLTSTVNGQADTVDLAPLLGNSQTQRLWFSRLSKPTSTQSTTWTPIAGLSSLRITLNTSSQVLITLNCAETWSNKRGLEVWFQIGIDYVPESTAIGGYTTPEANYKVPVTLSNAVQLLPGSYVVSASWYVKAEGVQGAEAYINTNSHKYPAPPPQMTHSTILTAQAF